MSYSAPPYATFAFPPFAWMASMPSITIESLTSIPPNPLEKSPNAIRYMSKMIESFIESFLMLKFNNFDIRDLLKHS